MKPARALTATQARSETPIIVIAAAVTSVFALKVATLAGDSSEYQRLAEQAERLVPLTFLVIVGTVSCYGLAAAPLAKWLGLADANPQGVLFAGAEPWIQEIARALRDEGFAVLLVDTNYSHVAAARMAGLPARCAAATAC